MRLSILQGVVDGERFDPNLLEDPSSGDGPLICEVHAKPEQERAARLALIASVVYTTYHAVTELGEIPSEVICEVDETALDELDETLRKVFPGFMKPMEAAAEYLKREPRSSFAQLKRVVAQEWSKRW